jgi:hypothetical protein
MVNVELQASSDLETHLTHTLADVNQLRSHEREDLSSAMVTTMTSSRPLRFLSLMRARLGFHLGHHLRKVS